MSGPSPARLARDTLASGAAIVIVGISLALHGVVVGRAFGDEALGHAGVALALGLGLPQLAGAGVSPAITRFAALRRAAGDGPGARRAATGGLAVLVGTTAAVAALAWPARGVWAPAIGLPAGEVAATMCLAVVEAGYTGLKATLYGFDRAREYARSELLAGIGFLAALAWLALAALGIPGAPGARPALVTPFIVADAVFVLLAVRALRRRTGPEADAPATVVGVDDSLRPVVDGGSASRAVAGQASMAAYALRASIGSSAAIARLRLIPIVLGLSHGAAEIGRFQAAFVFFGPVMLVPRAVELALFPSLAGAHGRGDARTFLSQAAAAQRAIDVGLALLAGGLIVGGPFVLALVFGPAFAATALPLALVAAAAWCLGLAVPSIVALSGADGIGTVNAASVLGLATSVLMWILLVPPYGATGAAAGLAIGSVPTAGIPLVAAARRYGLRPRAILKRTAVAALAACSLAAAIALTPGIDAGPDAGPGPGPGPVSGPGLGSNPRPALALAASALYAGAVMTVTWSRLRRSADRSA